MLFGICKPPTTQPTYFFLQSMNPYIIPGVKRERLSKEEILKEYFKSIGYPLERLREKDRRLEFVLHRNIYMYVLKTEFLWTYTMVGEYMIRNHATVINSMKQTHNWLKNDKEFSKLINGHLENIEKAFRNGGQ